MPVRHSPQASAPRRRASFSSLRGLVLLAFAAGCASPPIASGTREAAIRADTSRAELMLAHGDAPGARQVLDPLVAKVGTLLDHQLAARVLFGRAEALLRTGDPIAARLDLRRGETLNERSDDPREQRRQKARAAYLHGEIALEARDASEALAQYRKARDLGTDVDPDVLYQRLYLSARLLGRDADAANWRARVRNPNRPDLAALERKLFPAPVVVRTPEPVAAAPATPRDDGAPEILGRARWGAKPIKSDRTPMGAIRRITVHHSATAFNTSNYGETAAHLRSIQNTHQNDRRWADIAYHFLIDRAGRVWEGRELRWQGAHAGNAELNDGNIGVCVLGDYEDAGLNATQEASLGRLLDWLRTRYRVPPNGVYTHREIRGGTSECPGPFIAKWVSRYRARGGSAFATLHAANP